MTRSFILTKQALHLIHMDTMVVTSPLGFGRVVTKIVLIPVGIRVIAYHQGTSGASTSSEEVRQVSPRGAYHGMSKQKIKVKTLKATAFSDILSARIILKLKIMGAKVL